MPEWHRPICGTIAAFACLAGAGAAQASIDESACMALDRVMTLAVGHDARMELAGARVERAEADLSIERSADRPQISAFARTGLGDGVQADNEFDNRVGVRVSQRLFSFGRGRLSREAATLRERAARFDVDSAREEIAAEAAVHFLAAARAKEEAEASHLMNSYYERAAAEVPRRLGAGLLKRSEATGVQAEYARFRVRRNSAELQIQQQRTRLATMTGVEVECISQESAPDLLRRMLPPTYEAAIDEALDGSPAIRSREANVRAADLDRERLSRARLPDIGVSGTSALGFNDRAGGWDNANRIGLDINMPIYSGGQISGRTAAAAAELRISESQLEAQRRAVEEETRLAWESIVQLRQVVRLSEEMLEALVAQSAALQEEYENGLVTLTELIEAKQEEFQGRLAEIDARYDLLEQQLQLTRLTGRLATLTQERP